jgi:hypothetical protein
MRLPAAALLKLPALLPACGGSGGADPVTVSIPSSAALDGDVSSAGVVATINTVGGVGDMDGSTPGLTFAAFFSFDISSIPAGVQVTGATLRIRNNNDNGSPQVDHGEVLVDDVDYGSALDAADPVQVFASAFTVLDDDTFLPQVLPMTARVAAAVAAGRPRFQLRLRYAIPGDDDGANDVLFVLSGESAPEFLPLLSVTYQP